MNPSQLWLLILCVLTMTFSSPSSFAAIQRESLWLALTNQQRFVEHKNWLFFQHGQLRVTNRPYPVRTLFGEGGIGYALNSTQQLWMGYYVVSSNTFEQNTSEHRLLQQFLWRAVDSSEYKSRVFLRTRLEESTFSDRSQNLVTLRHSMAYEHLQFYQRYINPLIFDEVFFHLNNPRYASTQFLSQNRLFLGVNLYQSKHAFWRIGYVNQYVLGNRDRKPEMNHIFAMTYAFGEIGVGLLEDS